PTPLPPAVPTPRPVRFPDDEAPHANLLEWWYYNGHLEDERGQKYGFHFVIFQGRPTGGAPAYIANVGITDLTRALHQQGAKTSVEPQPQGPQSFAFRLGSWELRGDPKAHLVRAETPDYALDLALTPLKPPALHGGQGWLNGPTGWTYYYSWPRMEAQGTLTVSGQARRVHGTAWMDHQWGDFTVPGWPAGWQWFALQLADGTDLMLTEARDGSGTTVLYGTLVEPDGRTAPLGTADGLSLEVLRRWQSPHTGADYPAGWRLRVASRDLEFTMLPAVPDQEITLIWPPTAIYWEGAVTVAGRRGGAPLEGQAYVELVGYVRVPGAGLTRP
ncbi:MAG: hypothetical protein HY688_03455, partial [Chloroflexi bacterium]|nr:hypothetical protein [Chloroflexota bacterium]